MRSYAIIGTGAIGGYYGARLHQAGRDVHFLAHRDYEHIAAKGLHIDAPNRELIVTRVHVYREARDLPACDVAVVALKSTQNHLLPAILPHVVKPDGVVLVLQNGLGPDEEAARIVGPDRVMGGLCFIAANKVGPGHILHLDYNEILLGEYSAEGKPRGITARMQTIAADFLAAQVEVKLVEDLLAARWHKLVWNVPFNALSVILRTPTDRLLAVAESRWLVEHLMREVVAAALACGRVIEASFLQKMISDTERMKPYKTSMMLDFESRRPMELDAIYGHPIKAAHAAGAAMPLTESMYRLLQFLDHENRA